MKEKSENKQSLKKTLQISYIVLILIMVIPTIYSIVVSQIHIRQYETVISNVSIANNINHIAKEEIPSELWDIVCGRKTFKNGQQYAMIHTIFKEIAAMKKTTKAPDPFEKLEVANRACNTLSLNISMLETQMAEGSSVTANEISLDEIRTITTLFSDIMNEYILLEIGTASETTLASKGFSVTLTILQIVVIIFSLVFSVTTYLRFSKAINEPLSDMQKMSTEIAQGNLKARTEIPDVEELSPLAKNMNLMAEQINLLIQKNIEEQANFQKAEMKALQAQITPHFLYNTFDTIIWLAEEEDTERVVKITKAFSEFLRISLSRGHEWITIAQELDHIKNYLTIQKIRYNDILNYEIHVDDELLDCPIIKLVLQPLIENAIYHGIKNKRGRGNIQVIVEYTNITKRSIKIEIKDNGAGFTPERLLEVQEELKKGDVDSEKLTSVYGLYNVNKKLKLYYGESTDGLIINSKADEGTSISFVIPVVSGDYNV